MKLTRLFSVLLIAFALLLVTLLSLLHVPSVSLAQGGIILMTKTLNRSTNVVRVGEVLTFTIAVTNNSTFTLTNVTVIDDYDQNILAFARSIPTHDVHNPGTGTITWTNVATPPLPVGQFVTVTVIFTVEHPQPATVNQVRADDIRHAGGQLGVTAEASRTQDAIGGAAPVLKFTSPPTATPQVGLPVTFTHIITNDGAAIMTVLPLTDTYDPAFLQFHYAVPTPSITSPAGQLVWTDLTTYFGDIAPFDSVVVTTVFTAITQIISTTNQVSTEGAIDEYNNDLTAGSAQVPILIIDNTSDDGSSDGDSNDDDDDDSAPAPAPTQVSTATPAPIATSAAITDTGSLTVALVQAQAVITGPNAPRFLPETGYRSTDDFATLFLALLILIVAGYLFKFKTRG